MSHRFAYYRVSTGDQSIEAQRAAMSNDKLFDREFIDEGISGGTVAASRPGFSKLQEQLRSGDTVCVYAIDRLGRDALDVQATVRQLIERGISVDVHGLGIIARGVGEIILAVLAQVADMERNRIRERTDAGRVAARASLAATGKTHKGKHGLGRQPVKGGDEIAAWRNKQGASIADTSKHFGVSPATVKRYCAEAARKGKVVEKKQERFEADMRRMAQMDADAELIRVRMRQQREHLESLEQPAKRT